MKKFTYLLLSVLLLSGCATVTPSTKLPSQNISEQPQYGKTKILFFNNSDTVLYGDGSWRIGIKINGEGIENLHLWRYAQLFLTPGDYRLELSHKDVFTFRDEYDFKVGTEPMYVEVYNGIISTKFKIHSELPENFEKHFKPARPEG
jgi:hypothetical protein